MDRPSPELEKLCIDSIRVLAIDAVQAANSGHPGLPLGAAPMAFALWTRHLRHNPRNPGWFNRDRFVLSAGHGSMLLYSMLHLTGYDLPMEELRRFRQWDSMTPGHPENFLTPGVEMATGPLGQGFATAVGMAIAERFLAATFNRPGHAVVDHHTYVLASDGDLMEGVTNEAASLAGHLGLGKLIVLYDDNGITIDGSTSLAFTEDAVGRFESLGWHTQRVDGLSVDAVDRALSGAKAVEDAPSLIACKTVIGYGSPNKAGTSKSHGAALGEEEVVLTKKSLGVPVEPTFWVADEARAFFQSAVSLGEATERAWRGGLDAYAKCFPGEALALNAAIEGVVPADLHSAIPEFPEKLATRAASGRVIHAVAKRLPTLIGGSADLAESNNSWIEGSAAFQRDTPQGRNLCFGVREHAMAAACNGITLHGGARAYGASFLIFSDYCRPSIRLSALMGCPTVFVFTHDSIGLGEDGPTHQPIEQLMSLRAIPNLMVMRPADANETAACWLSALARTRGPSLLALSRQALPTVTPSELSNHPAAKGAYILNEPAAKPAVVLIATGSEVSVALSASVLLAERGVAARVVSMPCWEAFEEQSQEYREMVLPKALPRVSIEAGATLGWDRYATSHVGIDRFGASAPGDVLMRNFGFTPDAVAEVAIGALAAGDRSEPSSLGEAARGR